MEEEKNNGIWYRPKVGSRVETGVVEESGKVLMAQEQLGMELLKTYFVTKT